MSQSTNRRQMRWWIPALLILLAVGTAAYLWFCEIPFVEPILIGIGLLTALLLGLWYIFFTGLQWRTRLLLVLISAGFLAALYFGVQRFTRIEGSIGGSEIPRLVWKWSPKREGAARPLILQPASAEPDFTGPAICDY
jgi:hypothetical protein